ncbi:MAG: GNAT family N-acetyltransferase [Goleter apudmare HA4340-LM2]|jgi:GNAT superfamily N-acetyltransferase|nr:GNAT family N-acetyltransferase [Goleter apudmare HA4340-LM2]
MTQESRNDAFHLINQFLSEDEYYLDSSSAYGDGGSLAIEKALELFLQHPELGFVWIAGYENQPVGVCIICFGISTSIGSIVAKLDDVFVATPWQNQGVGSTMITSLKAELRRLNIPRIDTSVHLQNSKARKFYEKHKFVPLNEEKLSCLL